MKVWKLVAGILSIILFGVVTFQSCSVGVVNAIEENAEGSGTAGIFVAILLLVGGIVSIAVRNSTKNGGNITLIVLFGLAAIVGFTGHGSYGDLAVWAAWCALNVLMAIIAMFTGKKKNPKEP